MQRSAQAAVDPQTKPPDLGCESACRQLSSTTTVLHLLLLLSPKADAHLPSHVGPTVLSSREVTVPAQRLAQAAAVWPARTQPSFPCQT